MRVSLPRPPSLAHIPVPATTTGDGRLIVVARALRGFADGVVSVLLAT